MTKQAALKCFDTDLALWTMLSVPAITWFSLTTYHSKLVLVGGWNIHNGKILNELWVSDYGKHWQKSLPPMPTSRYGAATENTKSSQYLVVAGGYGGGFRISDKVEVYSDGVWSSLQSIPLPQSYWLNLTFHNGNLFINAHCGRAYTCKLESMLAACRSKGEEGTSHWKSMTIPFNFGRLVSLGGQLVAFEDRVDNMYAFSPLSQSWLDIRDYIDGVIPDTVASIVTTSNGQLLVVSESLNCLVMTTRGKTVICAWEE